MPIPGDIGRSLLEYSSGDAMYAFIRDLYPECRSVTGDGVRKTLSAINEALPLVVHEVPTGTAVFDWTIPREWNIREAWIRDPAGRTIVRFEDSNLHVLNYSIPVHERLMLDALKPHLHSLPEHPDWIPYRTSYYSDAWGFCLTHRQLQALPDGEYEVFIDSSLEEGALTYGECLIEGDSEDEILLSAHVCHPSLANDNLSGNALLLRLGAALSRIDTRFSYRLIFAPGTIGSITWLSRNADTAANVRYGLVVSCVGDAGGPTYKRSRQESSRIDRVVSRVFSEMAPSGIIEPFSPYGYDERQYCSPGFNLPVGLFERSKYGAFPEYHTSADNLDFVSPEELDFSYRLVVRVIDLLETEWTPVNCLPHCEPQLGKRGLYEAMGGDNQRVERQMAMLWILNLADGEHSLYDIVRRSGIAAETIEEVSELLKENGLIT